MFSNGDQIALLLERRSLAQNIAAGLCAFDAVLRIGVGRVMRVRCDCEPILQGLARLFERHGSLIDN